MCPVYTKLFNVILHSGHVPESWTVGIVIPIYKNKGRVEDPNNNRGITLLSCLGKLFTSLISKRLGTYIEHFGMLGSEQAGFRKNYSTVDHLFVLYTLINIYVTKEKKNYIVPSLITVKHLTMYLEFTCGQSFFLRI